MSPLQSPGHSISPFLLLAHPGMIYLIHPRAEIGFPGCFSLSGLCDGPFSLNQGDSQAGYTRSWELALELSSYPAPICWQQNTVSF